MYAVLVIILTLTVAVLQLTSVTASCTTSGWFGTGCKYQCHCANDVPCEKVGGSCTSGCDASWFGPACQYNRISFMSTGLQWLSDNDPTTCNQMSTKSVNVELETAIPLTWVRIAVRDPDFLKQISMSYKVTDSSSVQSCSPTDLRTAEVDSLTLDIYCPTDTKVEQVVLSGSGVAELCSLDISGGRNVALKQSAEQHKHYLFEGPQYFLARFAVDGENALYSIRSAKSTCSHTDPPDSPDWWSVTFSTAVNINRIVIINRKGCEDRLTGFELKAHPEPGNTATPFEYKDEADPANISTTVVPSPKLTYPVHKVVVTIPPSPTDEILSLCEVYVFGEVPCPDGKFGLACDRQCNCDNQASCFVHSGGCTDCAPGRFGANCKKNCGITCGGANSCDRITGECSHGCDPGFIGSTCETQCSAGTYGSKCSSTCSSNCAGPINACNHESGACTECEPGLYGFNCTQPCSDGCAGRVTIWGRNHSCRATDGTCHEGCLQGYTGDRCDCDPESGYCTICEPGLYGDNCTQSCSDGCAGPGNPCRFTDGSCFEGCLKGYTGDRCDKAPQHEVGTSNTMWVLVVLCLLAAIPAITSFVWWKRRSGANSQSIDTSASRSKEGELPEKVKSVHDGNSGSMKNLDITDQGEEPSVLPETDGNGHPVGEVEL